MAMGVYYLKNTTIIETMHFYIVDLVKIPFLYLLYEKGFFDFWNKMKLLSALFGNISNNNQTTSIGYQCYSRILVKRSCKSSERICKVF